MAMGRFGDAARILLGQHDREPNLDSMIGDRSRRNQAVLPVVTAEGAFKNSVWWAGLRLRANLMSTFPIDVVRERDGVLVPVPSPGRLFSSPSPGVDITEFLYSRQIDLDRYGNAVGIIRERNALGLPAVIELQLMEQCKAQMSGGRVEQWKIGNEYYQPRDIWHEKQYTMAGFGLGLAPLAYAAYSMGIYASAQEFALDWFGNGALPRGTLKNVQSDKLSNDVRTAAKEGFKESTLGGDIFVHGAEWEWTPAATTIATAGFLDQKTNSEKDVARYVGVPAGLIDVEVSTGNITYANALSANLQFLVTELGPSVVRLQNYWSENALPKPWKLRMNTDSLLRMDPMSKAQLMALLNTGQLRTKTELRALDNLGPFTPEDLADLGTFSQMSKAPATPAGPVQKAGTPWLIPS